MDKYNIQFVGSSCGEHGSYTFYKSFKYCKDGIWKVLNLGEFFYVRTSRTAPVCIAELQLLWNDKGNGGQLLCSCRLYYLPDHIPNGRTQLHGQDEVVANHNKVVLKLQDLLQWMCDDIIWPSGTESVCNDPHSKTDEKTEEINCSNSLWISSGLNVKEIEKTRKEIETKETQDRPRVLILSYPNYCRYKAVLKRIENTPERMRTDAYVTVLGGIVTPYRNTKLLFCRDTTDIPSLINHNKICDELAPNLKGRPRKKRTLQKESSVDEDYEPTVNGSSSKENDITDKDKKKPLLKVKDTPRIRPKVKITPRIKVSEEAKFLESLNKFMFLVEKKPIERIPHLGFKQIDLFLFYNEVKKIGGYDAVCDQRKWKQMYDVLGGNPGSTSAATCTRRHYERLLLSYERHVKGEKAFSPPPTKVKRLSCSKDTPQPSVPSQKQEPTKTQSQAKTVSETNLENQSKPQTPNQNKTEVQTKPQSLKLSTAPVKVLLKMPAKPKVKKPRAKMLKDHVREMEERKRLEALKAQQLAAMQKEETLMKNNVTNLSVPKENQAIAINPIQATVQISNNATLALATASTPEKTDATLPQASYPILKCMSPTPLFATIKQDGQPVAATVHTIPNPGIQLINAFQPVQVKQESQTDKVSATVTLAGQIQSVPTASRASVIQHTHNKIDITNKPGMVQPCDLILREKTESQRKVEKEKDIKGKAETSSKEETIIITPRILQPQFLNLGYMTPQMILSANQIALMQNSCPQLLQTQYLKPPQFNQRMDTSGKKSVHTPSVSVSNRLYNTPEQEEPCDLSLPKKRKLSENKPEQKVFKSANNLPRHSIGHRHHSEISHRSKINKSASRHFDKSSTHKFKMTPDTRGSITQGVIDQKKRPTVQNSQISPLKGTKAESARFTIPQVPTMTFNPLTGFIEGAPNSPLVFPDIKSPLLASACPPILPPRFIPGHLLNPQLLQARHDQTGAFPEFLRQRMFLPPFTSANLAAATRMPSDAKHSPVYRA